MQIHLKTKYCDEPAEVSFSRYIADKSPSIEFKAVKGLVGEPLGRATVCLEEYGHTPADGMVFIKDVRENEGMFDCLANAGLVTDAGWSITYGYGGNSTARVGKLTPLSLAELDKVVTE